MQAPSPRIRWFLVSVVLSTSILLPAAIADPPRVALTIDDPDLAEEGYASADERDARIRAALAARRVHAALFVCGMRIDHPAGRALLAHWDHEGHRLGNHTYSHASLNADTTAERFFIADTRRAEALISGFAGFRRWFRYPFLKEGETAIKRDAVRAFLAGAGYRVGHVTIDASDWYISSRLAARLRREPGADLAPYRRYYLAHLLDRAEFYDRLAREVLGHPIRHTLLLHHNRINALFLGDVIEAFRAAGWKWIEPDEAFADPVFARAPQILPAGESLVWALAKESGRCDAQLRYPGESDAYEKPRMDALGL